MKQTDRQTNATKWIIYFALINISNGLALCMSMQERFCLAPVVFDRYWYNIICLCLHPSKCISTTASRMRSNSYPHLLTYGLPTSDLWGGGQENWKWSPPTTRDASNTSTFDYSQRQSQGKKFIFDFLRPPPRSLNLWPEHPRVQPEQNLIVESVGHRSLSPKKSNCNMASLRKAWSCTVAILSSRVNIFLGKPMQQT